MLNEMEDRNLSKEDRDKLLAAGRAAGRIGQLSEIIPKIGFTMAVGDVNSDEMGTAARANGGKAAFDLLPLAQVSYLLSRTSGLLDTSRSVSPVDVIDMMARFQRCDCDAHAVLIICMAYHINQLEEFNDQHPKNILAALEDVCHVFDYGRKKYAEWNWAKGAPWSVPIGCIMRHIEKALADPEGMDVDSNYTHTGHIMCNAMMLVHYEEFWNHRGPDADNRPFQFFGHLETPKQVHGAIGNDGPS